MKKVLVFLAQGFEEVEAVTPVDFLRRAEVDVTTVGVGGKMMTGAHNIAVQADITLAELLGSGSVVDSYDGIVFPGGLPGAENLAAEGDILKLVDDFNERKKIVAAICASPGVILTKTGALEGKSATSYPGFEADFGPATTAETSRVVVDGNLITSRGPGTSAEFAIELIKVFTDEKTAEEIKNGTLQNF